MSEKDEQYFNSILSAFNDLDRGQKEIMDLMG
jgi:hypothetical protein